MRRTLRFAPAPSGLLHAGNLWVYWINRHLADLWQARLILRIDDTLEEMDPSWWGCLLALKRYLRMSWDCVSYQSTRNHDYQSSIGSFQARFHEGRWEVYLKSQTVTFYDHFRMQNISRPISSGNICLFKDGQSYYHLASIVDDIQFGVTDVVRANDHVSNTGLQIALLRQYGQLVRFYHVPLMTNSKGEKLSKSDPSHRDYLLANLIAEQGIAPQAFWDFFRSIYRTTKVNHIRFDIDKLRVANRKYLQSIDTVELTELTSRYLSFTGTCDVNPYEIVTYFRSVKPDRLSNLRQVVDEIRNLRDSCVSLWKAYHAGSLSEREKYLYIILRGMSEEETEHFVREMSSPNKVYVRVRFFKLTKSPTLPELFLFFKNYLSGYEESSRSQT